MTPLVVFTIGHSTRTIEDFIRLLKAHRVQRGIDVRTIPRSRHNPQFDRGHLSPALHRARMFVAAIGQGMALLFGFFGLLGNPVLIFIALFVRIGAAQEASMVQMKSALAGIPVRRAMLTHFRTLTPANTLGDAADLVLTGSQQDCPVVQEGRIQGVLTRGDLLAALTRRGREAPAIDAMRRECPMTTPAEMLETALARLRGQDCHTMPVTERGLLVGLVTMDNVGEFLLIQAAEKKAPV